MIFHPPTSFFFELLYPHLHLLTALFLLTAQILHYHKQIAHTVFKILRSQSNQTTKSLLFKLYISSK